MTYNQNHNENKTLDQIPQGKQVNESPITLNENQVSEIVERVANKVLDKISILFKENLSQMREQYNPQNPPNPTYPINPPYPPHPPFPLFPLLPPYPQNPHFPHNPPPYPINPPYPPNLPFPQNPLFPPNPPNPQTPPFPPLPNVPPAPSGLSTGPSYPPQNPSFNQNMLPKSPVSPNTMQNLQDPIITNNSNSSTAKENVELSSQIEQGSDQQILNEQDQRISLTDNSKSNINSLENNTPEVDLEIKQESPNAHTDAINLPMVKHEFAYQYDYIKLYSHAYNVNTSTATNLLNLHLFCCDFFKISVQKNWNKKESFYFHEYLTTLLISPDYLNTSITKELKIKVLRFLKNHDSFLKEFFISYKYAKSLNLNDTLELLHLTHNKKLLKKSYYYKTKKNESEVLPTTLEPNTNKNSNLEAKTSACLNVFRHTMGNYYSELQRHLSSYVNLKELYNNIQQETPNQRLFYTPKEEIEYLKKYHFFIEILASNFAEKLKNKATSSNTKTQLSKDDPTRTTN